MNYQNSIINPNNRCYFKSRIINVSKYMSCICKEENDDTIYFAKYHYVVDFVRNYAVVYNVVSLTIEERISIIGFNKSVCKNIL